MLAIGCAFLLTACSSTTAIRVNDEFEQCRYCIAPQPPYTDEKVAEYCNCMYDMIGKCRALLGHKG